MKFNAFILVGVFGVLLPFVVNAKTMSKNYNICSVEAVGIPSNQKFLDKYIVKSGDTLVKISEKFYGVSNDFLINRIAVQNHISNVNMIYIGECINIPIINNNDYFVDI